MNKIIMLVALLSIIMLSGCKTLSPKDYCNEKGFTDWEYESGSLKDYDFYCYSKVEYKQLENYEGEIKVGNYTRLFVMDQDYEVWKVCKKNQGCCKC